MYNDGKIHRGLWFVLGWKRISPNKNWEQAHIEKKSPRMNTKETAQADPSQHSAKLNTPCPRRTPSYNVGPHRCLLEETKPIPIQTRQLLLQWSVCVYVFLGICIKFNAYLYIVFLMVYVIPPSLWMCRHWCFGYDLIVSISLIIDTSIASCWLIISFDENDVFALDFNYKLQTFYSSLTNFFHQMTREIFTACLF